MIAETGLLSVGNLLPVQPPPLTPGWWDEWAETERQLLALLVLENDWNGDNAPPPTPELIQSALLLVKELIHDQITPPQVIYPLPDGHFVLEWTKSDGVVLQLEIESPGSGEVMIAYPEPSRCAEFHRISIG